jgi:hypothetical protein
MFSTADVKKIRECTDPGLGYVQMNVKCNCIAIWASLCSSNEPDFLSLPTYLTLF